MYYARFKTLLYPDVAVFKTEQEREAWINCEEMKGYNPDWFDFEPGIFQREPMTVEEVAEYYGVDDLPDVENLETFIDETTGIMLLSA